MDLNYGAMGSLENHRPRTQGAIPGSIGNVLTNQMYRQKVMDMEASPDTRR